MSLKLFNTLSRKKEEFRPIRDKKVGLYTCGPTVYDYDHIGHAWNYFTSDILRRVLEYNGYEVKHVMNITDVGHLTSDADSGEDKIEKSARESGKTAWEIAEYFTKIYLENRKKMNFLKPHIICKATEHIPEMIKMVQILLDKGYAYEISDGIYFDTSKFPAYGQLSGNTLKQLKEGARVEVNPEKRNLTDFALWKFSPASVKRQMEWRAFGKMGFPGWHIECSAMSIKYLGNHFDIHTGGEDNIFPHHESEIAQSESATGEKFVNFWVHTRFLLVEGRKMSKSRGNFYTLGDLEKKGFSALDLRYLFLQTHYRQRLNFTWRGLRAAQIAYAKLRQIISEYDKPKVGCAGYEQSFLAAINDDLNIPKALAVTWDLIKDDDLPTSAKKQTLLKFDKVLGLDLDKVKPVVIPKKVQKLVDEREQARAAKAWPKADKLRQEIKNLGFEIEDSKKGPKVKKVINK
jgi:cysteinyl-tRNA synthetase